MSLFEIICFRIILYVTIPLTLILVGILGSSLTEQGGGIFLVFGWPLFVPPLLITPWYLIRFKRTKFAHLSLIPPLTAIPFWYLIRTRFAKEDRGLVGVDDGGAVFESDTPVEERKTKRFDLWKFDHAVALIWTGVMGLISLAITFVIFVNLVTYTIWVTTGYEV